MGQNGVMVVGTFIIGMITVSLAAGLAGAWAGLGFLASAGLAFSVMIAAQVLYAFALAVMALGRCAKGRRDRARLAALREHDVPTGLNGGNAAPK